MALHNIKKINKMYKRSKRYHRHAKYALKNEHKDWFRA